MGFAAVRAEGRRAHSKAQGQQPTAVVPSVELLYKLRFLGSAEPFGPGKVRAPLVFTLSQLRNGVHPPPPPQTHIGALPDVLI